MVFVCKSGKNTIVQSSFLITTTIDDILYRVGSKSKSKYIRDTILGVKVERNFRFLSVH